MSLTVDTPEGRAIIVPSRKAVFDEKLSPPGRWVLVEYPGGRRRYWHESQVTIAKP